MIRRLLSSLLSHVRATPGEIALVAVIGAAIIVSSALVLFRTAAPAPPMQKIARPSNEPTRKILVHVAGSVNTPGVYELAEGSRVRDAIVAAGGSTDGADIDALNLAALLSDGQKIFVPRIGEAPAPQEANSSASAKVDLNAATQSQLEELPGVGPVLATRIIDFRQKRGPFRSVRQLLEVEGFGEKKFEAVKDLVTV